MFLLLINRATDLSENVPSKVIISESTATLTILYILYTFLEYKYKLKTFENYFVEENYIREKRGSIIGMNIYIFLILFLSMIISGILMNWNMMKERFPYIVEEISYLNFLFNFSLLLSLSIFLMCKKRKIISYLKVIIYFLIAIIFYKYDIKYDLYENICIMAISNLLYEILLDYQEVLIFKDDFIILLKYRNQEIKIKNSEKIKVIYLKKNIIINFFRFLNGKKQIYITDGDKKIYFGYFISSKRYKEILILLNKAQLALNLLDMPKINKEDEIDNLDDIKNFKPIVISDNKDNNEIKTLDSEEETLVMLTKGSTKNERKSNSKKVAKAKEDLQKLKEELKELEKKPNKTPEDKDKKNIKKELSKLKKSKNHSQKHTHS
ncbi:hypothetical protein [Fusobacterium sp. 1001295B_180824_G3]|uniref:hypothetical protein n=1 Tax=Fusobacterium sp. 1001295B_180824_G3 TaxID=2787123 RepID=UPI000416A230|nr:hypothetical protein [Fusobacterium sp. 1001295B_180824_G3]